MSTTRFLKDIRKISVALVEKKKNKNHLIWRYGVCPYLQGRLAGHIVFLISNMPKAGTTFGRLITDSSSTVRIQDDICSGLVDHPEWKHYRNKYCNI